MSAAVRVAPSRYLRGGLDHPHGLVLRVTQRRERARARFLRCSGRVVLRSRGGCNGSSFGSPLGVPALRCFDHRPPQGALPAAFCATRRSLARPFRGGNNRHSHLRGVHHRPLQASIIPSRSLQVRHLRLRRRIPSADPSWLADLASSEYLPVLGYRSALFASRPQVWVCSRSTYAVAGGPCQTSSQLVALGFGSRGLWPFARLPHALRWLRGSLLVGALLPSVAFAPVFQ